MIIIIKTIILTYTIRANMYDTVNNCSVTMSKKIVFFHDHDHLHKLVASVFACILLLLKLELSVVVSVLLNSLPLVSPLVGLHSSHHHSSASGSLIPTHSQ